MFLARRIALAAIRLYQMAISPWLGPRCRHWPSCSAYAAEAIARYGVGRGGLLALRRLARCHPWGTWGVDPVPDLAREREQRVRKGDPARRK